VNRWDEIKETALDAANWVSDDPYAREQMADELIKLVSLMIQATGKGVAVEGEGDIGQGDHTCDDVGRCVGDCDQSEHDAKAHNRYLVGERIRDSARTALEEAVAADLGRYGRSRSVPRATLSDCCNPTNGLCGGSTTGSRCVKAGGCCYSVHAVCPKHH
jgi:hypothetical protein